MLASKTAEEQRGKPIKYYVSIYILTTVQACTHKYHHDYVVTCSQIFQHGFSTYGIEAWQNKTPEFASYVRDAMGALHPGLQKSSRWRAMELDPFGLLAKSSTALQATLLPIATALRTNSVCEAFSQMLQYDEQHIIMSSGFCIVSSYPRVEYQ